MKRAPMFLATLTLLLVAPSAAWAQDRAAAVAGQPAPVEQEPFATDRFASPDAAELARTARQAVRNGSTDESCTGWRNTFAPPPSIRVLRTMGPAAGTVQEVPFRAYVATVLSAEWPGFYPVEALKTGAIAVKQYGWYYTIVYRGQVTELGECYDVRDDTDDQYYQPELSAPALRHLKALDLTWNVSLRKFQRAKGTSRFFLTGYRSGTSRVCGEDANGWKLFQHSVLWCAKGKLRYEQILRIYLDPNLEIVDPGTHDIVAEERGDAAAMVALDDGLVKPRLWAPMPAQGFAPYAAEGAAFDQNGFRGSRSVDLTQDGRDDLLILRSDEAGWRFDLAASDGSGYTTPGTWWAAPAEDLLAADATLLSGDVNGDGRQDPAILSSGSEPGTATLRIWRNTPSGPKGPGTWWLGALDLAKSQAWLADATGDGRADLLVARDLGEAGVEYLVAPSPELGGALGALTTWFLAPEARWSTTRHAVGDYDRDGREDLWLATPADTGLQVAALRAAPTGAFEWRPLWSSAVDDGLSFDAVKLGSADIDFDGRGDLILFADRGDAGTRLVGLRSRDGRLKRGPVMDDASLDWEAATPF